MRARLVVLDWLIYLGTITGITLNKEYGMARRTNGSTTPRSKKTTLSTDSAVVQSTPVQTAPETVRPVVAKPEVVKLDVRENVQATVVAAGKTSVNAQANLDE